MEATFVAKRALFNIPKFFPQSPPGIQSNRRVAQACLSTAFEHAEGRNVVAEAEGSTEISNADKNAIREGMNEEDKYQTFATGEGRAPGIATSFGAKTARDSIKKAVEVAENVGDTAKKTLDGAWSAAKETAQGIKERVSENYDDDEEESEMEEDVVVDEVRKVDQLVDTQEYRSIEEMKKLEDDHKPF